MSAETIEKIRQIIEPVLVDLGLELVEIQLRNEGHGLVLRVIIYKEAGITLDDCSQVSREVGFLLEVDDPISRAYHLEVSSPGLDRPLKTERDFERNIGKKITVVFDESGERHSVTGRVDLVKEGVVTVSTGKKEKRIPVATVVKAKLLVEF